MLNDFRHAFRQSFKNPGFTAVSVLTLALGIGATTAIFSVANAVLLRPLSFKDPSRLVMLWETIPKHPTATVLAHPFRFHYWKENAKSFQGMAGLAPVSYTLSNRGEPERVGGALITSDFLGLLGLLCPCAPCDQGRPDGGAEMRIGFRCQVSELTPDTWHPTPI